MTFSTVSRLLPSDDVFIRLRHHEGVNLLHDVVVPQLARPHGLLTRPFSWMLNRGNRLITAHSIGALDVEPNERVLEVGFGGGVGLAMVREHQPTARVSGVDVSPDVVLRARRQFPELDLHEASVEAMPFEDGGFDAVFAVNVAYFWKDVDAAVGELVRVLRPKGRLALGVRPAATCARMEFARSGHHEWDPERYAEAMRQAGLGTTARRMPDPGGGAVVVLGVK